MIYTQAQTAIGKFTQMNKAHKCFASIRFDVKMFLFVSSWQQSNKFIVVDEESGKYVKLQDFFSFSTISAENSTFS